MSHVTGRHRRRRRGWVSHTRWVVGAILAAIIGAAPTPRAALAGSVSFPQPPHPARNHAPLEPPTWAQRYEQMRRAHSGRVRSLYLNDGEKGGAPLPGDASPIGWCVDDDGVRGVRPYLIQHEQRERCRTHSSKHALPQRSRVPDPAAAPRGSEEPDEWEELAGLVRQWAQQRPACHA